VIGAAIALAAFIHPSSSTQGASDSPTATTTTPSAAPTSTDPSSTPATPSSSVAAKADVVVTYLADTTTVNQADGPPGSGLVQLGGSAYPHSIFTTNYSEAAGKGVLEYDLQRTCSALKFTAGITDDSSTGSRQRFEVYGDGRLLASIDVAFGQPKAQSVDVTNVLRLRLVSTLTVQVTSTAAWGDAQVSCAR
jgi:hypothetical protein